MAFALTFDDGPGPSTGDLLALLEQHRCLATFFLIGGNVDAVSRSTIVHALSRGHLVGNHTMSHSGRLSLRDLRTEIEACDQLIESLYTEAGMAVPVPVPFRLPFGIRTFLAERMENGMKRPAAALDNRLQALASMGRTHVHWTAILPDWEAASTADGLADSAMDHIAAMEKEGLDAVLAMHDGSPKDEHGVSETREKTVRAVELILERASKKGWSTFRAPVA